MIWSKPLEPNIIPPSGNNYKKPTDFITAWQAIAVKENEIDEFIFPSDSIWGIAR